MNIPNAHAVNNPRNIYELKSGDYLWKIANTYRTSVEDLKLINGLQSDLIVVGQKLRIPIIYEVVSGDSLWKLSQAFKKAILAFDKFIISTGGSDSSTSPTNSSNTGSL
nr:LysM peptidoglycan-binding domain-containing protein [Paenibacillus prosopidis]